MATLARLVVKLVTDVTEFTSGMGKASEQLHKIGDGMQQVGGAMTLGVTLPLVAAGVAAVKFASDLEETRNKTSVVFGEMAKDVLDFSESSARDLGMSKNAALSAASTFGNLFVSMGIGKKEAANMSIGLVQLAADLASFNNLDPSDVFLKLQSGIVGEAEPLRALGVNLSAAAIELKAFQLGLGGAGGELSEQAKVMARYAIIMEQTKTAQGDFARTSDGLANSTRILKAQFEDMLAVFGENLLPIATKFMQTLIPILEGFNKLPDAAKQGIVYLLMFAAALGPIIAIGGKLLQVFVWIGELFGPGGALASAAAWITGTMVPALAGAGVAIKAVLVGILAFVGGLSAPVVLLIVSIAALVIVLKTLGPQAWEAFKMLFEILKATLARIKFELDSFAKNVITWARTSFGKLGENIVTGIWEGIKRSWPILTLNLPLFLYNLLKASQEQIGAQSPSKVWAEKIGLPMAQGIGVGFAKGIEAITPNFGATLQPSYAMSGPDIGVRPNRNTSIEPVKTINIYGDLSTSAKEKLREEIRGIFYEETEKLL